MKLTKNDQKFLELIDTLEPKAKCLRANIACVLVKNNKILVKATNDWHREADCTKIGCIRNIQKIPSGTKREICYGLCAEQWALAKAAKNGISINGATCYVTKHPCRICESLLSEAGIKKVIYQEGYPDSLPKFDLFRRRGILVHKSQPTRKKSPNIPKSHTI
jgi:dCMP deaminase